MDRDLKITGDNPFYVSYRDWRLDDEDHSPTEGEQRVVYRWFIPRHPCLGIEVVPIADSALELDVRPLRGEPGQPIYRRRVPQTLKVTLSCNDCGCGKQTARIKYHMSTRQSAASFFGVYETSLSIICVGPDCEVEEVMIEKVSYEPPEHAHDISLPGESRER